MAGKWREELARLQAAAVEAASLSRTAGRQELLEVKEAAEAREAELRHRWERELASVDERWAEELSSIQRVADDRRVQVEMCATSFQRLDL